MRLLSHRLSVGPSRSSGSILLRPHQHKHTVFLEPSRHTCQGPGAGLNLPPSLLEGRPPPRPASRGSICSKRSPCRLRETGDVSLTHLEDLVTHSDPRPGCRALFGHPGDEHALGNERGLSGGRTEAMEGPVLSCWGSSWPRPGNPPWSLQRRPGAREEEDGPGLSWARLTAARPTEPEGPGQSPGTICNPKPNRVEHGSEAERGGERQRPAPPLSHGAGPGPAGRGPRTK